MKEETTPVIMIVCRLLLKGLLFFYRRTNLGRSVKNILLRKNTKLL